MSTGVVGSYFCRIKFGDSHIDASPGSLDSLEIIERLDRLVPYISLTVKDRSGLLTHLMPFDSKFSRVQISLSQEDYDETTYVLWRKKPESQDGAQSVFSASGLLDVDDLFTHNQSRGFDSTNVKDIITQIGKEIGCTHFDIDESVNVKKSVYQPNWTNAKFLTWLADTMPTSDSGYFCYINASGKKRTLVFKSLTSLLKQNVTATYVYGNTTTSTYELAYNLKIYDNSAMLKQIGAVNQRYNTFIWESGISKQAVLTTADIKAPSLCERLGISEDDTEEGYQSLKGRTSEYSDYAAEMTGKLTKRVNSLVKIWIDVRGNLSLRRGNVIKLVFMQGAADGTLCSYQFSGFWLIDTAIQSFNQVHVTRLLLTRPGVDTDVTTTKLKKAKNVRRS